MLFDMDFDPNLESHGRLIIFIPHFQTGKHQGSQVAKYFQTVKDDVRYRRIKYLNHQCCTSCAPLHQPNRKQRDR